MSEQELYEIAQKRIDRRNRSLTILGIHGTALVAYVGAFIILANTDFVLPAVAILIAWSGLFVLHCIQFGLGWSRDSDIEGEVRKLRKVVAAGDYEKPKRLALGEDGEIVEFGEENKLRTDRATNLMDKSN
jgi:hypothetical protein